MTRRATPSRLSSSARRRVALFAGILFLILAVPSAPTREPQTLEQWFDSIERAEERLNERWGVSVRRLADGESIVDYRADRRLIPASNRKLMIFILALEKLGPEYRFRTELGLTGRLDAGGVLHGHAVLRGNGDPTFSYSHLRDNPADVLDAWIARLRDRGVKRIRGDFIIDASAFGEDQDIFPPAWELDQRNRAYAPLPSALAMNRNLLQVKVRPGAGKGSPGRVELYPSGEGIRVVNKTKTDSRTRMLHAEFHTDGIVLEVTGKVGVNGDNNIAVVPYPRPLAMFRNIAREALRRRGVALDGNLKIVTNPYAGRQYQPAVIVAEHESAPLYELLTEMLTDSDNFLAEQIWRATAHRALGVGDTATARRLEQAWYAEHDVPWIEPGYDGSGLSRMNKVSPDELIAPFLTMLHSPYKTHLIEALPVSGRSGTLRRRSLGPRPGRVIAKTGSLNGVSALTGLILDRRGDPQWVFSILANAPGDTNGRLTMRQNQFMNLLIRRLDRDPGVRAAASSHPPVKRYRPGTKEYVGSPS